MPEGSTRKMGTESLAGAVAIGQVTAVVIKESEFKVGKMVKGFAVRLVKHWHMLPRMVMHAPSLKAFQARLNGALSNKVWLNKFLFMPGC